MATSDDVLALVPLVYDASLDPHAWLPLLNALNSRLSGSCSVLHLQRPGQGRRGDVMAAVGVEKARQQDYEDYYGARNVWVIRGRDKLIEGAVLRGETVCPNADLERSEYYNDYLKQLGFYYALAAVPAANARTSLIVTTFRSRRCGTFSPEAVSLQRLLIPHLQRAAQIHGRLAQAEFHERAFRDVLESLPTGVVLLDPSHHVLFANRVARSIANQADGFILTEEGPAGAAPGETVRLRGLIASATAANDSLTAGGGLIKLQRPSARRAYEVLVAPLGSNPAVERSQDGVAVLFISDPEDDQPADLTLLQRSYGLTPSEARFANALLRGHSLTEIASSLGVTMHTARWTVKQVLSKTETRSQGQAIARMLRGLARLRVDRDR